MSAERFFFDTNVLVYAFDADEPEKQRVATELLRKAGDEAFAYFLSTQVLQEFYAVVTRKLARPLAEEHAADAVRRFAQLPVVATDASLVLQAISLSRKHRLSVWDALILQAAVKAECPTVLSEDLQHGFSVGLVRVVNPFRPGAEE